jgi:hypothetical protein
MALTLIEAAKRLPASETLRTAVIEVYARQNAILEVMPFETIQGNALKYNVEQTLPGVAFRGVNESYTESTGVINPVTESLMIIGGELDVDNYIIRTMGEDQRAAQVAMKLKALAHNVGHRVVKGDSQTDQREFDGLQARLTGTQLINPNNTSSTTTAAALSFVALDEAADAVDNPTHYIMTREHGRLLSAASRVTGTAGFITFDLEELGRRVMRYNGIPIIFADRNADLFATLGFNENDFGGGGTATNASVYCVSFSEGGVVGLQDDLPRVTDFGEIQAKPVHRVRMEWYAGMAAMGPRAASRIKGLTNGAIVNAKP